MTSRIRCHWAADGEQMQAYHDTEWGVPLHDDRTLFEFLCLEGAQAGLSWRTVLQKREHYRRAFHRFDIARVAAMKDRELEKCLLDPGLIRNRLKITATRDNAKVALEARLTRMETRLEIVVKWVEGQQARVADYDNPKRIMPR